MTNNKVIKAKDFSKFKEQYKKELDDTKPSMMTNKERMVVIGVCIILIILLIEIIKEVWYV